MLVEDNPTFRELVKLYLQSQFSIDIIQASEMRLGGKETIFSNASIPDDLILLGVKTPQDATAFPDEYSKYAQEDNFPFICHYEHMKGCDKFVE